MTRERWGWILVALAAVLLGVVTRAPAMSMKVQHRAAALARLVQATPAPAR